jgi:hypothetical protein
VTRLPLRRVSAAEGGGGARRCLLLGRPDLRRRGITKTKKKAGLATGLDLFRSEPAA